MWDIPWVLELLRSPLGPHHGSLNGPRAGSIYWAAKRGSEVPVSLDRAVLSFVGLLYDAAIDESLWPTALKRLADLTGSQAATFWTLESSRGPRLPVFATFNFDDRFVQDYLQHMVPLDPTVKYLVAHPEEPIVHDDLVLTERDKDFSAYYDWQRRECDINFRLVGQTRPAPEVQAGVALHRSRKAGKYEVEDLHLFAFLHGHLQRALAIAVRLGSLGAMNSWSTAMLDSNPAAIVLLDEHKRVVYTNRPAEVFRSGNDGARLSPTGLVLARKQDDDKLQKLIARVLLLPTPPGASAGVVYGSRPSGKRPFCIAVTRVGTYRGVLATFRPAVCITIADPEVRTLLQLDHLTDAFGLTQAEARLAALLATGKDLRSAAIALGITYATARARLAQIFGKTQTRRQAELVRVLLSGLAGI
jgi:DNA-binding CsgD family transcriptional regulator